MEASIDKIINNYMEDKYFPSCVCKVFTREDIIYNKAFGNVDVNTIFDVASLSKIATSTQILMLINESKLKLESKLEECLPIINKFKNLKNKISDVTIKNLLTHNSGIIDWYPFYSRKGNVFDVLDYVIGKYEKVEGVLYSDLNFIILGEIIKFHTSLTLDKTLKKYIKDGLSIKDIYYNPIKTVKNKSIAPSCYGNPIEEKMCEERNIKFDGWRDKKIEVSGFVNDGNCYYFFDGISGHAGIFADVESYAKICQFYLNSNDSLFNLSIKNLVDGRGLGWQISDIFPNGCGHTGFTGTSIYISKEKNIGAVIFTNRLYKKDEFKNLNKFRKEVHCCILENQ